MPCPLLKCAAILLCLHLPSFLTTTGAVDAQVMDPSSASTVAVIPVGAAVDGVDSSLGTVNPVHQDAASDVDAAREDAVALTEALEGGDYAALVRVVGERVAPRVGGGAYATALVDALGARGMVRVAAHLPTGGGTLPAGSGAGGAEGGRGCRVGGSDGTGAAGVGLACTWTSLLATATTSPLWDEGHREALARDLTALVTVTGDLAEPDTLLLPLGFRRLLTADQDPLTAAAAGTQAPGAGGGQSGSRDPLALDPKFLASLVRGLMAGEAAGGSRIGWVEYARLTTTAGGGYSNFPEGTPQEVRARYSSYDPLAAVLTATARRPQTVLDVLAPPLPGAALGPSPGEEYEFRQGRATKVDATTWEWVAARTQESGTACLEALTSAAASASTLRYKPTTSQPNPYEAQAAWLTEQAVVTLAGMDTTTWTPTARRTTAVMLANSMSDVGDAAAESAPDRGTSLFGTTLPVAWSGHHDAEVTALLREVLTDDTALSLLFKALSVFNAYRIVFGIKESTESHYHGGIYRSVLSDVQEGARLYGYLYSACATGRGVGEGEESPAAGVVLAALDQGPAPWSLDPHTLWQPLADPAQATQATTTSSSSLTQGQLRGEIAARLSLEAIGVLDAARLIPQDAYTLEDGRPAHDWITLGDDGMWHLDQEAALADPAGLDTWLNDAWTEQDLSRVTTWLTKNFDDGVLEAQDPMPATAPGAPVRHAALVVVVLSTATTLLVYSLSHTHQRRRERLRPRREERRRRWRERIRRW